MQYRTKSLGGYTNKLYDGLGYEHVGGAYSPDVSQTPIYF